MMSQPGPCPRLGWEAKQPPLLHHPRLPTLRALSGCLYIALEF